jgi:hypothetical protein
MIDPEEKAELVAALLGALMGSRGSIDKIKEKSREEMERGLLAPAREHRAHTSGSHDPFDLGPAASTYIDGAMRSRATARGMLIGLTELLLDTEEARARERASREQAARTFATLRARQDPDAPTGPTGRDGLDWAALRAERDLLAEKLSREERKVIKAEHDREIEARNARTLLAEVTRRDERIGELERLLRNTEAAYGRLQDAMTKQEADLLEAQGKLATAEEQLAAVTTENDDLIAEEIERSGA